MRLNFLWLLSMVFWIGACVTKMPPMVKSFKTPEETFETWRQAAERLDLETLVACYASNAKAGVRKDIEKTSQEGLHSMQEETRKTKFKIEKIVYEKDRAYLRAQRSLKGDSDIEVLTMVKEGEEWKLLP